MAAESALEKRVTDWAKAQGVLSYKFVSPSNKGVPDRVYIGRAGTLFLEFKAPGCKPTKLQALNIAKITSAASGGKNTTFAAWTDDYDHAVDMINSFCIVII